MMLRRILIAAVITAAGITALEYGTPASADGVDETVTELSTDTGEDCSGGYCAPPCESNPSLAADDLDCVEACDYDSSLAADDPYCLPPCEYDSGLYADDAECVPPCEYNPDLKSDDPACEPLCEYNPDLQADDPYCEPPCEYDPELSAGDPACEPLCEYNPDLQADDPYCEPPCEYDPELSADDPACEPEMCEYDPQLPVDDPACEPEMCEYDPQLPVDDPACGPPCVWNPDLIEGDEACEPPSLAVLGICYEVAPGSETVWGYWYEIHNPNDTAVAVTWDGGAQGATIGANGNRLIVGHDGGGITVSLAGHVITSTGAPDDERCENNVTFEKEVQGVGPGADTEYTILVSRMVPGDDDVEYVQEIEFTLKDNESKTIPLPSTFNEEGIAYQIQEIEDGGAIGTSIDPNSFILHGHKGETISVKVINTFASVEINKVVSKVSVLPGDEITYTLDVTNSGGLTLDPVVIDDRMPDLVTYVGYEIEGGAASGSCTLTEATKPQLVTCSLNDAVPPGGSTPTITLLVSVDGNLVPGQAVVNQARVRGTYEPLFDLPQGLAERRLTQAAATDLTCEPTENEVCDLSARVSSTVGDPGPTTSVASRPPATVPAQVPPTTVTTTLPRTGSDTTSQIALIGLVLLLGGIAVAAAARRKPTA